MRRLLRDMSRWRDVRGRRVLLRDDLQVGEPPAAPRLLDDELRVVRPPLRGRHLRPCLRAIVRGQAVRRRRLRRLLWDLPSERHVRGWRLFMRSDLPLRHRAPPDELYGRDLRRWSRLPGRRLSAPLSRLSEMP